jgi:putative ABC transport system ATP-binding protein|nr:ATP-binding cassette domain-containing protein [Kofleriaceae bacterium]
MRVIEMIDLGLDHPRGGGAIVHNANLAIAPGEVVLIVGAAGVGTSRLVAAALGEAPTASGRIEVLGRDVGRLRRSSLRLLRRRVGIVPQDLCLLEDRSARDNVCVPLDIDGIPRAVSVARALEVLGYLGLADVALVPICGLSWSERQRVAVARALIREPELIIADHPTSMQDAEGAELVCGALASASRRGTACVVLGRDPALRAIAEREAWRTFGLVGGALRPIGEVSLDGKTIDDLLVDSFTAPIAAIRPTASGSVDVDIAANDSAPETNLIPFPAAGGAA